jgi:hypothetical protein
MFTKFRKTTSNSNALSINNEKLQLIKNLTEATVHIALVPTRTLTLVLLPVTIFLITASARTQLAFAYCAVN